MFLSVLNILLQTVLAQLHNWFLPKLSCHYKKGPRDLLPSKRGAHLQKGSSQKYQFHLREFFLQTNHPYQFTSDKWWWAHSVYDFPGLWSSPSTLTFLLDNQQIILFKLLRVFFCIYLKTKMFPQQYCYLQLNQM